MKFQELSFCQLEMVFSSLFLSMWEVICRINLLVDVQKNNSMFLEFYGEIMFLVVFRVLHERIFLS